MGGRESSIQMERTSKWNERSKCTCTVTPSSADHRTDTLMADQARRKGRKGKRLSSRLENENSNDLASKFQNLSIDQKQNEVLIPETNLPQNVLYYGWFFSHETSLIIKELVDAYIDECLKIPQFERFMKDCCALYEIRDPQEYYRRPGKAKASDELQFHITAKFLGREPNIPYAAMVHPFIEKTFGMHLVGLYFTQKTCGVRVELTDGQKVVFDEREGTTNVHMHGIKSKLLTDQNISNIISTNKLELEIADKKLCSKKATNPKCKSELHSRFAKKQITLKPQKIDDFQPTTSRAHITIGCAPKVKAIQTGIDLLDVIDLEKRAISTSAVFHQHFHIDGGTLRQFGRFGDAFVVYPCHKIIAEATFNAFI